MHENASSEAAVCTIQFSDIDTEMRDNGALAQLARASALQAECQGFESLKLHQPSLKLRLASQCPSGRIAQLVRARL